MKKIYKLFCVGVMGTVISSCGNKKLPNSGNLGTELNKDDSGENKDEVTSSGSEVTSSSSDDTSVNSDSPFGQNDISSNDVFGFLDSSSNQNDKNSDNPGLTSEGQTAMQAEEPVKEEAEVKDGEEKKDEPVKEGEEEKPVEVKKEEKVKVQVPEEPKKNGGAREPEKREVRVQAPVPITELKPEHVNLIWNSGSWFGNWVGVRLNKGIILAENVSVSKETYKALWSLKKNWGGKKLEKFSGLEIFKDTAKGNETKGFLVSINVDKMKNDAL